MAALQICLHNLEVHYGHHEKEKQEDRRDCDIWYRCWSAAQTMCRRRIWRVSSTLKKSIPPKHKLLEETYLRRKLAALSI
jgi:hypothetical protein